MRSWAVGFVVLAGCVAVESVSLPVTSIEVELHSECPSGSCVTELHQEPLAVPMFAGLWRDAPTPTSRNAAGEPIVFACGSRPSGVATYHAVRHGLDGGTEDGPMGWQALGLISVTSQDRRTQELLYELALDGQLSKSKVPDFEDGGVFVYRLDPDPQGFSLVETHTLSTDVQRLELHFTGECSRPYY